MTKITVSMIFESKTPLTDKQRAILRNLVDDYQCAIGESVGMDEIEWSIESEPVPSLQEELRRLYGRVTTELEPRGLFDDDFQNAFQALSEVIEYHGGGKHKNYLYEDNDSADCVVIGAGGEVWTGSMPSWD